MLEQVQGHLHHCPRDRGSHHPHCPHPPPNSPVQHKFDPMLHSSGQWAEHTSQDCRTSEDREQVVEGLRL